jgi:hypothetical protein
MAAKTLKGITVFSVLYNMLGIFSMHACVYGFKTSVSSKSLIILEHDYVQMGMVAIMILFFATAYLIIARRKAGIIVPVFLLTFFIFGGFVILVPLLAAHLCYFLNPAIKASFT